MLNSRPYSYAGTKGEVAYRSHHKGMGELLEYVPHMPHYSTALAGMGQIVATDAPGGAAYSAAQAAIDTPIGFTDGLMDWTNPGDAISFLPTAFSLGIGYGLGLWTPIIAGVALLFMKRR